jgi:hypothetical protein
MPNLETPISLGGSGLGIFALGPGGGGTDYRGARRGDCRYEHRVAINQENRLQLFKSPFLLCGLTGVEWSDHLYTTTTPVSGVSSPVAVKEKEFKDGDGSMD